MKRLVARVALLSFVAGVPTQAQRSRSSSPLVRSEFIFTSKPTPSVHASTIAETRTGLVAAWYGGKQEGAEDVGIWVSRWRRGGTWSRPSRVTTCVQERKKVPCWNPVLYETTPGVLTLYYKAGPNPREWWGLMRTSRDGGASWSAAQRLPVNILGPIKNKPVRLTDGSILSPSSTESPTTPIKWRVQFEKSADQGRTWTVASPPVDSTVEAIQPTILQHPRNWLQALVRTQSGHIYETWSDTRGATWTALGALRVPNPNSGIDALAMKDGRFLLAYNHTSEGRSRLDVAVSMNGRSWGTPLAIENGNGEFSYPAIIQTGDSLVHITYTWKRQRIVHLVLDPRRLVSPRNTTLDSMVAVLVPKLAPLAASRDSQAIMLSRDSATERADAAVMRFRETTVELLNTIVETYNDSAFQRAIFPSRGIARQRINAQKERGEPIDAPDFAVADSLHRFLRTRGVYASPGSGDPYYTLSESAVLETLGRYTTASMRAYLRLEAVEQVSPSVEDLTLQISLRELEDRLAAADSVVSLYPRTLAFQQTDWLRSAYLSALLNGTENSPAFRRATRDIRPEVRQSLERYALRHGALMSGKVVKDYLVVLKAAAYKDTPAVTEFRKKIQDAVGPRRG